LDTFRWIATVFSMILGLGVARLLTGAVAVFRARGSAVLDTLRSSPLASEQLAQDTASAGTAAELTTLERQGRDAWQRFLLANVRLVQSIAPKEARRSPAGSLRRLPAV